MWTPAQRKAFAQAIVVCEKYGPILDQLAEIAKHSPAFAEQVAGLKVYCDQMHMLAQTAIAAEAQIASMGHGDRG